MCVSFFTRPSDGEEPAISESDFYSFAVDVSVIQHLSRIFKWPNLRFAIDFIFHLLQVALALDFLASNKYVHRDIAARNCLGMLVIIFIFDIHSSINIHATVGSNLEIKIADFGLARSIYDKDYYKLTGKAALPVRWMAPECLIYGIFTTASDVW